MATLSGLTDAQIEESKHFFASCSHAAVHDRILLIRLRRARDQAEEVASAAH